MAADDDALMDRFERNARRFRARDALIAVAVAIGLLVLIRGTGITPAGKQLNNGVQRSVVLAVGKPAGKIARQLPLHDYAHRWLAGLSPDEDLGSGKGFSDAARSTGGVPFVTADAFDPREIGAKPPAPEPLKTLLVTGDSLSTPLDDEIARRLTTKGVKVVRDPHLGSGISKSDLVDWGKLANAQVAKHHPDAVIVFIGANEGFPLPAPNGGQAPCCTADWAATYANRARQMINTYRQGGRARVYWLTVMTPRDPKRVKIQRVVNAAIEVAVQPWRRTVSLIDTIPIFTPQDKYRDSMPVDGKDTLVRESDGIHLNRTGASILAGVVVQRLGEDFSF